MGIPYNSIYCNKNNKQLHALRLKIVQYADKHSIRATAQYFDCSRNTVKKWVRRYYELEQAGETIWLGDNRPNEHNHPQKMDASSQEKLIAYTRYKLQEGMRIIVKHIKDDLKLLYSTRTCIAVLRRAGLITKKRKKRPGKVRDLRRYVATLAPFSTIQVDIKYLCDIPEFAGSKVHNLYQFSARDRSTGIYYYAYALERTTTMTTLFIEYLLEHLRTYGVDLSRVTIQTDNGKEFTTWWDSPKSTLFEQAIEAYGAEHTTIPMKSPTFNSTVEAGHRLIEDECYGRMCRPSVDQFLDKARLYQKYFNHKRVNTYRSATPQQLLRDKLPAIDGAICTLTPILLETRYSKERRNRWRSWQGREIMRE